MQHEPVQAAPKASRGRNLLEAGFRGHTVSCLLIAATCFLFAILLAVLQGSVALPMLGVVGAVPLFALGFHGLTRLAS